MFQSTPVGSVIFNRLSAVDPDANVNGQIEYRILDDERSLEYDEDGVVEAPYFKIDLPHQGLITVARPLDYETQKMHIIRIVASVILEVIYDFSVQKYDLRLLMYPYLLLTVSNFNRIEPWTYQDDLRPPQH